MKELVNSMPFAAALDIEITHAEPSRVEGELLIREDLCTIGGAVHGGVLMSLADSLGAVAAFLNLPEGARGTTTIESKTNFLRAAPAGSRLSAVVTPVSAGRRLCVLTTTVSDENGKPVSVTTQTQLVLAGDS